MPANLMVVGAAFQSGVLPLSASAIEWAIELNGVAVAANTAAFRWGRVAVADPAAFAAVTGAPQESPVPPPLPARIVLDDLDDAPELARIVRHRAAELAAFQDVATARRYVSDVRAIRSAERAHGVGSSAFSEAAAAGLYRLTAYKDEYEVARLLTDPAFEARLAAEVPGGSRMRYRLHPPVLRSLGRDRKIAFGPWMRPVLRGLARGKVLRGTPFDPFGHTEVRRLERELRDGYRAMVLRLAGAVRAGTVDHATAAAAARAAEEVRGYEGVKMAGVERYRQRLADLGVDPG